MFNASKLSLLVVIIGVLLAAGYLIYSSYSDARSVHNDMTQVIRDQQSRRVQVASMIDASRERSFTLLKMAYEEDIFVLDELNQEFSEQARIFIAARDKLLSMPLTNKEQELLARHRELVKINAPKQDEVAQLFLDEDRTEALKLLFSSAIPGQLLVIKHLALMLDEYNKNSMAFIESMDKEFEANTQVYILLGVLLLVIGTIAIVIMLTRVSRKEELQLSQALSELAEQKFALDQHAIVCVTDVQGKITYANDRFCNLSGYSKEEIIGQNHRVLSSGKKDKAYWREMYRTIANGGVWSDDICNKAKDGRLYWVNATMMPLMGEDNKPRGYISIRTDITERKQAEQALRRSQKMDAIGQLTGGIAHDFNNLLNIILGNLELLDRQLPEDEKIKKRLANIQKSSKRAAELTHQLLSFSRHQAENVMVIDINQLIEEMESLVAHSITPLIDIDWRLAKKLWSSEISPGDFEDALLNIIINARDAMSGNGHLTIETANVVLDKAACEKIHDIEPGEYVCLSVRDDGEGMPPEQLEHIFEPFYTTKEQGKGTGLGLAMVFGFIQRSKGSILVESEPGFGTTFQCYLPRAVENVNAAASSVVDTASEKTETKSFAGNEAILVVDDEEALLELAKESLLDLGYRVQTAGNGQQALDVLTENPDIDLLISDVIMPGGLNGYQLAERAISEFSGIKVLLASGYTEKGAITENNKHLGAGLLSKPYSQVELAQRVREVLSS